MPALPRVLVVTRFHAGTLRRELEPRARVTYAAPGTPAFWRALQTARALLTPVHVPVDAGLLARAPVLEVIGNFGVGYSNVDLDACRARGIAVVNTPDVVTRPTAELALALLLAAARRLPEAEALARTGDMSSWTPWSFLGLELKGRHAVLVGRGRIGRETERLFKGIGLTTEFITRADTGPALREKLARAQVLSLHVRLEPSTHHWLDAAKLARLPRDCIVINTTRGPVVDERALVAALKSRRIFAAGLDVYEHEPRIPRGLTRLKNTVLLPHIGTSTDKARSEMTSLAVEGTLALLSGQKARNRVV